MDVGSVVVAVAAILIGAAVLAVLLRGRLSGSANLGSTMLRVRTEREPKPQPGSATITRSHAETGDATAIGPGGARIDDTVAGRNLIARSEDPTSPKE